MRHPANVGLLLAFLALGAGCAADRPIHLGLDASVARPERAVVVFFIDGLGRRQFDEAMTEGRLPHVMEHLYLRGAHVQSAVACIPAITYANAVTFLTGRFPGRHGVISNLWYDPTTGQYQNYSYVRTYQEVDRDYNACPTIHEMLVRTGRLTVSLQAAQRRGASLTIDNWMTSGINWFFENSRGVDCLVAQDFEEIAAHARRWRRWPDLILAYLPGVDHIGHAHGPQSGAYRSAVANCDQQIGRICQALKDVGMFERTFLCLVSDHGQVPVRRENYLDLAELIHRRTNLNVWQSGLRAPADKARLERDFGYVLASCGSRFAAVYPLPKAFAQADGVFARLAERVTGSTRNDPIVLPAWLSEALAHPAVEMAACSFQRGRVHLFTRAGHAVVTLTSDRPCRHTVWQEPGREIFKGQERAAIESVMADAQTALVADAGRPAPPATDARLWLERTANLRYPDLVPQIVALFESPRAGNVVLFAAEGWDFSLRDPAGGHGSILADDLLVPVLIAGPGIPAGRTIPCSRNCDLAPTILHLLGVEPVDASGRRVDMDGTDLLPCLDSPRPVPAAS